MSKQKQPMSPSYIKMVYEEYAEMFEKLISLEEAYKGEDDDISELNDLYVKVLNSYMEFTKEAQKSEIIKAEQVYSKPEREISETPLPCLQQAIEHSKVITESIPEEFDSIRRFESEDMRDSTSSFVPVILDKKNQVLMELIGSTIAKKYKDGNTILHNSIREFKGVAIVAKLIEVGADPADTNDAGDTALHVAVRAGHLNAVELLRSRGARYDVENEAGETPLSLAGDNKEFIGALTKTPNEAVIRTLSHYKSDTSLPPDPVGSEGSSDNENEEIKRASEERDKEESRSNSPAQSNLSFGVDNTTYILYKEDIETIDFGVIDSYEVLVYSKDYNETEESLKEVQEKSDLIPSSEDDQIFLDHKEQHGLLGIVDVHGSHILA